MLLIPELDGHSSGKVVMLDADGLPTTVGLVPNEFLGPDWPSGCRLNLRFHERQVSVSNRR
jgi:hypothetical protein